MKSEEYKRGFDAGYKAALLDALSMQTPERRARYSRMGGPDAPKPSGIARAQDDFMRLALGRSREQT